VIAHIRMYKIKSLCGVRDWHSSKLLLALGLDADCAHRVIVCISTNQGFPDSRIHMG